MTCSDWISIICASISPVVAIVIAGLQLWQSGRMAKFEQRQDERDERHHAEEIKWQAVSFILRHYADRGLIPLCAMASMHNDLHYYSREIYREFCCMTLEIHNRVFEYCGLGLRIVEEEGLFERCVEAVAEVLRTRFPGDESPFYDGGKYVLRSLERYGCEKISVERINYRSPYAASPLVVNLAGTSSYKSRITDVLNGSFRGEGPEQPISPSLNASTASMRCKRWRRASLQRFLPSTSRFTAARMTIRVKNMARQVDMSEKP